MTNHTRRKQENQAREMECWRRRVQGETQEQIAAALGITQSAVSQILRRLGERFAAEFIDEVRAQKALQTARLEVLYEQLLDQWERSCQTAEKLSVTSGRTAMTEGGPVSLPDVTTTTRFTQTGNPALIAQALKALSDIRDLWGLNAPARSELAGPSAGPITIVEVDADGIRRDLDAKIDRLLEQHQLEAQAAEADRAE